MKTGVNRELDRSENMIRAQTCYLVVEVFWACLRFNLSSDANNTVLCVFVCVCVWAAEGLVAREILTYWAPTPCCPQFSPDKSQKMFSSRLIYNLSLYFIHTHTHTRTHLRAATA